MQCWFFRTVTCYVAVRRLHTAMDAIPSITFCTLCLLLPAIPAIQVDIFPATVLTAYLLRAGVGRHYTCREHSRIIKHGSSCLLQPPESGRPSSLPALVRMLLRANTFTFPSWCTGLYSM
jgi:hypothetical protein